jgi:hypothetical protein
MDREGERSMSANTIDSATYNAVVTNTVDDAVADADVILPYYTNVKNVVNQHATEIDAKLSLSGGNVTGITTLNNNVPIASKESGGTSRNLLYMDSTNRTNLGATTNTVVINTLSSIIIFNGTVFTTIVVGNGSPEGAIIAVVGSLFLRADGGTSTTLYVKQSGSGNTGWVAK